MYALNCNCENLRTKNKQQTDFILFSFMNYVTVLVESHAELNLFSCISCYQCVGQ
jgi:hypothetical protein